MIFTTHDQNIPQIKALVNHFGGCYVHGDGNMYSDNADGKYHSDNHKKFCNPKREECTYVAHFKRGDMLPKTKKELDEALMRSKNQEILSQRHITQHSNVRTFAVEDTDVYQPEGEIDYSQFTRTEQATPVANKPGRKPKAQN